MSQSRRTFLKAGAAAAAAALAGARGMGAAPEADAPSATPLAQFGYGEVELLEGPMREQFQTNHAFYAALDEDSLLKPFRQRAGLAAPGEEMGGWYSWAPLADLDKPGDNGFAPGHSFGQYLSGLSRDYAATGDKSHAAKVHSLVRNFAPAISPTSGMSTGFPHTPTTKSPSACWTHTSLPALRVRWQASGQDARLGPGPSAAGRHLARRTIRRPHRDDSFCWDEPYTLPENFFIAWQRGAGERYRDMAVRFLADDWYFDPLAAGENVLPGKHAYSHVNA
jgi:hypothetical protein